MNSIYLATRRRTLYSTTNILIIYRDSKRINASPAGCEKHDEYACTKIVFFARSESEINMSRTNLKMKKDTLDTDHCADALRALAAPERLRIIRALRDGPLNVTDLASAISIPCL